MHRLLRDESGIAMGLAVIVVVIVGVMGAGLLVFVRNDLEAVVEVNQGQRAFEMADAGVQAAKQQLNEDSDSDRYDGEGEDDVPWSFDENNSSCGDLGNSGMCLKDLDNNPSTDDMVNVTIESNSDDTLTVISTGGYGAAKRKIEAVFTQESEISIPPAYFAGETLSINGSAGSSGISLFSRGNVNLGKNFELSNETDKYFEKWAETDDNYSYPNDFNPTPRPSEKVGIGAAGEIIGSNGNGNNTSREDTAPGTRSFDRNTETQFVAEDAEEGEEITFPFDTSNDVQDLEALREQSQRLEAKDSDDFDYYRTEASSIDEWPPNSDYGTVVFYDLQEGSNNTIRYNINESGNNCDNTDYEPPYKGVIVINNGNFEMAGTTDFSGGIIVRGIGDSSGNFTGTGTACLKGYANVSGKLDMQGTFDAGAAPDLRQLPSFSEMRLISWRELYE